MRNLRIVASEEVKLPSALPLTATAWDSTDDSIVCAFGPTESNPIIELKRKQSANASTNDSSGPVLRSITSWDAPSPLPGLGCDEILLLQYFADTSTACLVLAGGDLVVVREDPLPGQEKIEIVGSVDVGIAAAAWAPDEELLAIVTRADALVLMSRDFEPITEALMTPDDLKASKHVSVGWGKKETQFQGKRAKALRDPTMPEIVDEGKLSPNDDGRVSVSWRGDGAFVAINSIVSSSRRVIRVYTREAVLDSASEPVDGLESPLSWRPSGNLIASIQRHEDRADVVFFERNGLRHGEFPFRLSKEELDSWGSSITLSWNIDSSVLAVSFRNRVQLWTMGNYHYYLKQEVCHYDQSASRVPLPLRWHTEKPLKLAVAMPASLLDLECTLTVCRGSTLPPDDHGIVAVIDGRSLRLTPLKHNVIPPPMAFCEIRTQHNIVDCSFSATGKAIAILTIAGLEIHEWRFSGSKSGLDTQKIRPTTAVSKISALSLSEILGNGPRKRLTQISFRDDEEVFVLVPYQLGSPASVPVIETENCQIKDIRSPLHAPAKTHGSCPLDTQSLVSDTHFNTVWYQSPSSTTMAGNGTDQMDQTENLPGAYLQSAIFLDERANSNSVNVQNDFHERCHLVQLTRRGDLMADRQVLARGCTSFLLTGSHLIFTTSQHLLKFVHLAAPEKMEVPGDTPEVDERCRSIERGARLVTAIPSAYSVVLQMPRGNLETIYPRVMVLAGIRSHILNEDFKSAFFACQTHQVDLNILHDYRPDLLMGKVLLFINQLKKVGRIDEFLSKLKDEDVSRTLYRNTLKDDHQSENVETSDPKLADISSGPQPRNTPGKVNRICDAFISLLETMPSAYLQNIITAHVSKKPPDLTSALSLVATIRNSDASDADIAISHLCFLTDANRLYDTALSLYDLELTLLVAQNSQRDPREYLPFLQSLHTLPTIRRQYQIDHHLRNYTKALTSLHALDAHDEVEAYTVKHSLYNTAMSLYKHSPTYLASTTRLYAAHLASISRPALAATLYESLGDYSSAYRLHALAHHWREALSCACIVPLDTDSLRSLATSLATTLTDESRDYRAAAIIHAEYLSDIPSAARLLCKGSYFAEASRLLSLHAVSADEANRILDSGLSEKFGEILELLADCKGQLGAQVPRILELRVKKAEDPLAFFGGDATVLEGAADIPDNISLAATDASTAGGVSLFTRYGSNASKFGGTVASNVSRKTSKTVRREERKRARGKKGSVYEEEYLVGSVGRLIGRVNGVQEEVGRLMWGLLRRGMEGRERAGVVDERMEEVVGLCEKIRGEIWSVEDVKKEGDEGFEAGGRPSGADGVLWDSQAEMGSQGLAKAPEVKAWTTPELLVL